MGLLINTQIGTDRGITDEGYIRIESFEMDRRKGDMIVRTKLFLSETAALDSATPKYDELGAGMNEGDFARNINIPEYFRFPMTSSAIFTRSLDIDVEASESYEEEVPTLDGSGSEVITKWRYFMTMSADIQEYSASVVDFSPITGSTVYEFAYPLIKYHLEQQFGEGSIVDQY